MEEKKTTEALFAGWRKDFDPMHRIGPAWVWYKCCICGAETAIGPTQELEKRKIGGVVACMYCVVQGGVEHLERTGEMPRVVSLNDGSPDQN